MIVPISLEEKIRCIGLIRGISVYNNGKAEMYIDEREKPLETISTEYLKKEAARLVRLIRDGQQFPIKFERRGEAWCQLVTYQTLTAGETGYLESSIIQMLNDEIILAIREIKRGKILAELAKNKRIPKFSDI